MILIDLLYLSVIIPNMKRKIFIISQSDRRKDHTTIKKSLEKYGIPSSIVNVGDNEHKKMIEKIGKHILIIEDNCSESFFNLRKMLFVNNVKFLSFGKLRADSLNIAYGNLDIGFNKDLINYSIPYTFEVPQIPAPSYRIAIDMPPETVPYRYLKYFRSVFLMSRSLISFLSTSQERHKPVTICATTRPYSGENKSSSIVDIQNFLGKRSSVISDISKIEKGTTVLTWSTKRFFLLLSMGFRPVPITKCLASSTLYSPQDKLRDMITKRYDANIAPLFQALESTKLENMIRSIYKLLEN